MVPYLCSTQFIILKNVLLLLLYLFLLAISLCMEGVAVSLIQSKIESHCAPSLS